MIVCHCKSINDKQIRLAVKSSNTTIDDVIKRTGCCTGCGSCEDLVQDIVDEETTTRTKKLSSHPPHKED